MPTVRTRGILGGILALALVAAPAANAQEGQEGTAEAADAAASERGPQPPDREPARIKLKLSGIDNNEVDVGERFKVVGKVFPFVPKQKVRVFLKRDDTFLQRRKVAIQQIQGRDAGRFELTSKRVIKPGTYRFRANKNQTTTQDGALAGSRGVEVDYPNLDPGDHGGKVRLFNKLLAKQAYHTSHGSRYNSATGRAVLAFRKVNKMSRTTQATSDIYRTLAAGKGGFKLKWPGGGKHIEADLSRQVMVLAKNGKPQHIFHISSGAPATPTIRGKYPTYRKDLGTNSLGMVHSVYFIRGYATHGYHSVPTYPASHGCLRNPIPDSKFIYDWISLGDVFYVYG
jgi:L,D-transpeptidase catalytic domain